MLQVTQHQVRSLAAQGQGQRGLGVEKGLQVTERRRKEGLGPAGPYSTDLLSHQKAKGLRFYKAEFFNLFSQEMRGS